MWKKLAIATWLVVAVVGTYSHLSDLKAGGGGHQKESPDGSAVARIGSFRHGGFLQKDQESIWIEISLMDKSNGNKQVMRYIDHDIDNEMYARGGGTIQWNEDSSGASFSVGGHTYILKR